ncbi:MAG: TGS domain-containing protein [Gammaproteobacteria bacterium]|nr:TGS domain-containing protein [Gammaproteobacteria bacterium]
MPTNVTADYKKAEQAFRAAREPGERLGCLKEMLRCIPKHKGTEHLQADIKSRIKALTEELAGPKKGAARTGPTQTVRAEGAAQIALLGPPGSGKSSLHAALTGSHASATPYTKEPLPGMLPKDDIHFQLIDLPPISADHTENWMANALQPADAALLVIDINDPGCLEQVPMVRDQLADKKIYLIAQWPGLNESQAADHAAESDDELRDPFHIELPTLVIANKIDLCSGSEDVSVLKELLDVDFPILAMSAQTLQGAEELGDFLFRGLDVVRVYTKSPGKSAEKEKPFTLRKGQTVADVARLVHKDVASTLRYARLWGGGRFAGQQVGPQHQVCDGDVLELHSA